MVFDHLGLISHLIKCSAKDRPRPQPLTAIWPTIPPPLRRLFGYICDGYPSTVAV
jgi:hypothetical protein